MSLVFTKENLGPQFSGGCTFSTSELKSSCCVPQPDVHALFQLFSLLISFIFLGLGIYVFRPRIVYLLLCGYGRVSEINLY